MKKLLFVLFMALSGQAAARNVVIPYTEIPTGIPHTYLYFHNTGCLPAVNSVESGNAFVAVWIVSLGNLHGTLTIYNLAQRPATGTVTIRLGECSE